MQQLLSIGIEFQNPEMKTPLSCESELSCSRIVGILGWQFRMGGIFGCVRAKSAGRDVPSYYGEKAGRDFDRGWPAG